MSFAPERADELKVQWGTEHGQLWKIEKHRLICGDCTDETVTSRLWDNSGGRGLRLIWTNPPYGVSCADKTAWMNRHGAQTQLKPIQNDDLAPAQVEALFSAALKSAAAHAERGAAIYTAFASELLGPWAAVEGGEDSGQEWVQRMLGAREYTIAGGTSEIHRNIIGERVLGLPKG